MSGFFDDALGRGEIGFPQKEKTVSCYDDDPEVRGTGLHPKRGDNVTVPIPQGGGNTIETVHHPAHYGGGDNPYEVIKVIHAWKLGFALGNAIKYIGRNSMQKAVAVAQGMKGSTEETKRQARLQRIDDLKKAVWYIQDEIKELENENR